MTISTDWILLARYLSEECTDEEKEKVEGWILSDSQNQQLIELMKTVWNTQEVTRQTSDVKKLWKDVAERAGIEPSPQGMEPRIRTNLVSRIVKWPFQARPAVARLFCYAAVLMIVVFLPYFFLRILPLIRESSELKVVHVKNAERVRLTLADGSRVVLDAGSSLRYPEKLKEDTRAVYLHGEGYFEVTYSEERPFVVKTDEAEIRVLGTKFNVRAWKSNRRVKVVVAEGRVSLRPEEGDVDDAVVILEGQLSTLAENGRPSEPRPVDVKKHLSWMQNEMVFEDTPLFEILTQLERWYDLRFVLSDTTVGNEHITAHIQKTSVDDILELISALSGLDYERRGRTVRFEQRREQQSLQRKKRDSLCLLCG